MRVECIKLSCIEASLPKTLLDGFSGTLCLDNE